MKVFIGSLVVCHILNTGTPAATAPAAENEARKTTQVTGVVKEIFKEDVINTAEDNIPVKRKKTMFLVSLNDDKGIIKIGAQACLPVVSEKEYDEYKKNKLESAPKIEKKSGVSANPLMGEIIKLESKKDSEAEKGEDLIDLNSSQQKNLLKKLEE